MARGEGLPARAVRESLEWAKEHQRAVGRAWDETIGVLGSADFEAISGADTLRKLRRFVHRWHDVTVEPLDRLGPLAERTGSVPAPEDSRAYLSRVLIGMDLDEYNRLCDDLHAELEAAEQARRPLARLDWRDRLVELMELGVRSSAATLEWVGGKLHAAEAAG